MLEHNKGRDEVHPEKKEKEHSQGGKPFKKEKEDEDMDDEEEEEEEEEGGDFSQDEIDFTGMNENEAKQWANKHVKKFARNYIFYGCLVLVVISSIYVYSITYMKKKQELVEEFEDLNHGFGS